MADDLYETLKQTAIKHIQAFESPNPFDAHEVYKYRAPGAFMYFHPYNSVPAPFGDRRKITWPDHEPALTSLGAVMDRMKFDIKEVSVDVKKRMVTARIEGHFDFKAVGDMPEVKDWVIGYVWITEHDDSGEKIVRLEETMDVVQVTPMLQRAGKHVELGGK